MVILQGTGTGTFSSVTPSGIAVGNGTSSVVTGDFNGDGNLDFAVANKADNTISVLRGNGTGTTFAPAAGSPFSTGAGTAPAAIAVADLNGGGQLDLAVAESGVGINRVDLFKGNGDGTFTVQPTSPATGTTPVSIVAGDFNADGIIDLAVTNSGQTTASILLGKGSFLFQPQTTPTVGTTPSAIASANFNGDGSADLAVANSGSNNVSILLNQVTDTASASLTGIYIPGNGLVTSPHNLQASYPGDTDFNTSVSNKVPLQSTQVVTSTLLSANTTTPTFGQQVVFTAALQTSPLATGALNPTGNVQFKDGGTVIGTVAVSGGIATLNITSLTTGTHSITAKYVGDANFLTSTSPPLGVIVSKATPVITWANPSSISYGMLLWSAQMNATTTVPGTFAYSLAPYTLLPVGTSTLSTTFTPTDSVNYTLATASVTVSVTPATPQISWATPAPITFGTALSGIQLNATVAVYDVVPLSSFYNVSGIYPDGASFGTGGFDGGGSAYSSNLLGTSVIWNNITYQLGPVSAPDAVSNTTITLPPGHYASLNMLGALVNNATAANTFVVTYTDNSTSTVTQSLSDWVYPLNYVGESNLTCVPYRTTSNGTPDAHLTCVFGYQIPLDSTKIVKSIQLPATRNVVMLAMALVTPPIPGTLVYTPPSGTVLPTGLNTLSAVFTPTDTTDYKGATGSVPELVNPANAPTLVWPTPAPITYGTALSSIQLNAQALTTPGTTSVSLASYYRVNAFQTDGSLFSTGGFDNNGNAYSANLAGSSVVWNGQTYSLGPANLPDAVTSTTITLPQGNFVGLNMIGAATTNGQTAQPFKVTYTDGTTATVNINLSSWLNAMFYPTESIVVQPDYPYINSGNGGRNSSVLATLYGYQIPLDGTKTVQSITLPNNRNVVIVAMSLVTSSTPTVLSGTYTYTPPAGTVPAVGTVPLSVLFTPTNTNYASATMTVNLVVNKAALTVTANSQTVSYGTALAPYSYAITGLVNGDTQATATTGAPSLSTTPANPVNAGTYTINTTAGTMASSNYSLSFVNGTVTITKPTLTVTANNFSRVYGAANPTFSAVVTGAVGTDTFTVTESTTATAASPVGTYSIVPVVSGTNLSNYNVVVVNGTLTVGQATLTVTAGNASRAYGAANPGFSASATGAVNGDTFSFTESTTATTSSPVGTYAIVPVATGAKLGNYTVVYVNGTLTVGKATLVVTANSQTSVYGAAIAPYTATITGFVNGDTQATATTGTPSLTTTPATPTNAGAYPITAAVGTLASGNYSFSFVPGTLTITKATLTVTAGNASRAYGAANPTFTASATGAVNGDTFSFTESTTATTSSPVGTYAIVPVATGANLGNYTVVYVNGTLTVGKATLVVTANNQTVVYGTAISPYTATITGLVNGDPASVVTGTAALSTSPATPTSVGSYTITAAQGTLAASNYSFTFATGTLTITKATLTVTAGNASRAYGVANPAFTASATGAVNGDAFSFTESTTATTSSPVGAYAIVPVATGTNLANYTVVYVNGTLTVSKATLVVTANNQTSVYGTAIAPYTATITGFVNGDTASVVTGTAALSTSPATPTSVGSYTITAAQGTLAASNYGFTFATGTLTITKATLTVTAGNASRAYGVANPAFSASATGAVNGDTFSFTESTTATTSSPVGTYAIVPVATGTNLANYTVVYVNGTLTVGQATLTVTAGNASRAYGAANPAFTASATGAVNGDTFSFTESTTATTELSCRNLCDRSGGDWREPRELHGGLRQRHPDGRPGDPDRNRRQRQPCLRSAEPGVHRIGDRRGQRRHLQLHRKHDGDPELPCRDLRDRPGGDWCEPRQLHRGLRQRHPDGRPGHPDGNRRQRQPRLRGGQPGVHRIGNRRGQRRHLQLHREHDRDSELSCRNLCDRPGGDWREPRELHGGLRQRHPDGRPGDPDRNRRQRQPCLRSCRTRRSPHRRPARSTATPSASPKARPRPELSCRDLCDRSGGDWHEPRELHRGLRQRHPDRRPGHPDGNCRQRQPCLRSGQPGVLRVGNRRGQRRHLQLHREHDRDSELACWDLCDRPGGHWHEPRELHGGLCQRHPDGRPGDPDGNRRQRQPRLRGGQPGVHRHRDRRDQRRHLQLHREHDGNDQLSCWDLCDRPGSDWCEPRRTTRWSMSTAP